MCVYADKYINVRLFFPNQMSIAFVRNHKNIQSLTMDYKETVKNDMEKAAREMTDLTERMFELSSFLPNDQSPASEKDLSRKISDIINGRQPPNISYDDGDQSPLSGKSGQYLRNQWSTGMDCVPHEPIFYYLSSWLKVIYSGDYDSMMEMLQDKSKAEIKKMIDRRESLMNISAIFHVVVGARTFAEKHPSLAEIQKLCEKNLNVKNEHIKILEKLLSLGADVNVRDVAGFTPLHYCAQYHGNKTTLKMAEILIEAGAKVDAQNRFGSTPLMESTMAQRYDLVKFFTKLGADVFLKDHDGSSPFSLSRTNPKMMKIFSEARKKTASKERERLREEAGGSFSNCYVCGKTDNTKRCTGCYFVCYCCRQCQKENWGEHKEECQVNI